MKKILTILMFSPVLLTTGVFAAKTFVAEICNMTELNMKLPVNYKIISQISSAELNFEINGKPPVFYKTFELKKGGCAGISKPVCANKFLYTP